MEEKKYQSKFRSVYSMGDKDFIRFDYLLTRADDLGIAVRCGNYRAINEYCQTLKALYDNWRPLIFEDKQKELDDMFKEIDSQITVIENKMTQGSIVKMDRKYITMLSDIHRLLLDLKQWIGLGIEVRSSMSAHERVKQSFRGKTE